MLVLTLLNGLIALLLTFFFIRIGYRDWTLRIISNRNVGWVAVLCGCLFLLREPDGVAIAAIFKQLTWVFIVGFLLFWLGVCGAGDIKLIAAITIGISAKWWGLFLLATLLLGGLIGGILWLVSGLTARPELKQAGVPYALAICPVGWMGVVLTLLSAG